ncbi:MAG: SCO family protein, partial [Pyrinomonadaceae bacterium]
DLKGKVVSVDQAKRSVVIDHEEVTGFMEPMVMPFTLEDRDALNVLGPGDLIQATLVVADDRSWLENPVITKGVADGGDGAAPAGEVGPPPGAEVPDFSLTNQDGRRINLDQYKGRALLLTFIYTRCPLPDYCTLMSTNFAEINRALEKDPSLYEKTHLLSVTLDPAHDTPKVLRSYGAAHTERYADEKFEHWEFATGDEDGIKRLARFFGLDYFADKDQIIHSLRTAIITPEGRVHKVYRGNEWKPSEVVREVRKLLGHENH